MFITPNWPAPSNIKALSTTRKAVFADGFKGASLPPYDAFNLATHVGETPSNVAKNRQALSEQACLPCNPFWLDQQHTTDAICLNTLSNRAWQPVVADASWCTKPNTVSVVMTADCIPLLITNRAGSLVSAIHAGWKGLADGIVTQTLQQLPDQPENLLVWIGPCIRQNYFEVGEEVYAVFTARHPDNKVYFKKQVSGVVSKYLADLAGLLKLELAKFGVTEVFDSGLCSYADSSQFYSYRRDGVTGRMASLIWIQE